MMHGEMHLNIPRMVVELRSEIELIDVAIGALEWYANAIGIEEPTSMPPTKVRRKPVRRMGESSDPKAVVDGMAFRKAQGAV